MPKKPTSGFTIIEVMIVLVIAAVILLIVFLAVPALQRNSRNNQRQQDVNRLMVTFQEYLTKGNAIPSGNITSNAALAAELKSDANVRTFDEVQITGYTASINTGPNPTENNVQFRTQSACNAANTNVTGTTSEGRVALAYWIESGSGFVTRCRQVR